jgi:hypothetical protein
MKLTTQDIGYMENISSILWNFIKIDHFHDPLSSMWYHTFQEVDLNFIYIVLSFIFIHMC